MKTENAIHSLCRKRFSPCRRRTATRCSRFWVCENCCEIKNKKGGWDWVVAACFFLLLSSNFLLSPQCSCYQERCKLRFYWNQSNKRFLTWDYVREPVLGSILVFSTNVIFNVSDIIGSNEVQPLKTDSNQRI